MNLNELVPVASIAKQGPLLNITAVIFYYSKKRQKATGKAIVPEVGIEIYRSNSPVFSKGVLYYPNKIYFSFFIFVFCFCYLLFLIFCFLIAQINRSWSIVNKIFIQD